MAHISGAHARRLQLCSKKKVASVGVALGTVLGMAEREDRPKTKVRQYALATALTKYGAMAGPGQIGPSVLTVDVHVGTGSELVRTQQPAPLAAQPAHGTRAWPERIPR